MRASLLVLGLSLTTNAAYAVDPAPAAHHIPVPCAAVSVAASTLFHQDGFDVVPSKSCPECLTVRTMHLHDPNGRSLTNVRTVMHRYMSIHPEKDIFGAWYVHNHLTTYGELTLNPEPDGCRAQLLFHFSWYATEILILLPVDGDPASRPSNLRLETDYLKALKP